MINTIAGRARQPSDGQADSATAAGKTPSNAVAGDDGGASDPGMLSDAQIAMAAAARLLGDAGAAADAAVADVATGLAGIGAISASAPQAAAFLKALGHDGRLLILAHLISGPKSVTELETLLSARQAVVSQQLARLRHEGLVRARRDGQNIIYSINDPRVVAVVSLLGHLFDPATGQA